MALETTERDISIAFEKLAITSYGGNHPTTIFFAFQIKNSYSNRRNKTKENAY